MRIWRRRCDKRCEIHVQIIHENKLSEDLQSLLTEHTGDGVTIGEIEKTLRGRGLVLLVMLLAAPFLCPVSIPGLSMPFGLVIGVVGFRLALGLRPWLPKKVLNRVIQRTTLVKIVGAAVKVFSKIEHVLVPRWEFMFAPGLRSLVGAGICFSALLLSLPIPPPIPFTNMLPAVVVILLAAGWMERDGIVVVAGYTALVGTVAYFIFLSSVIFKGFEEIWQLLQNWWA